MTMRLVYVCVCVCVCACVRVFTCGGSEMRIKQIVEALKEIARVRTESLRYDAGRPHASA